MAIDTTTSKKQDWQTPDRIVNAFVDHIVPREQLWDLCADEHNTIAGPRHYSAKNSLFDNEWSPKWKYFANFPHNMMHRGEWPKLSEKLHVEVERDCEIHALIPMTRNGFFQSLDDIRVFHLELDGKQTFGSEAQWVEHWLFNANSVEFYECVGGRAWDRYVKQALESDPSRDLSYANDIEYSEVDCIFKNESSYDKWKNSNKLRMDSAGFYSRLVVLRKPNGSVKVLRKYRALRDAIGGNIEINDRILEDW